MTVQELIQKLQTECNPTDFVNFSSVIEGIGRDEMYADNADLILRRTDDDEINFIVIGEFEG